MSEVKWIKIVTDIFDNKKIKMLEAMPEGDSIIVIWLKLLILAGNTNDNGLIYFTKDIPYTDQMLATIFNRPLITVQLALSTFQNYGMIEIVDDILRVSNWEKYQNIEGMERIREQTRKRVARYRESKKLALSSTDVTLHNVTETDDVTQSNAIDIDIDIDIDKDIDKNINNPPLPPLGENDLPKYDFDKHTNLENVKHVLNNKLFDDWTYIKEHPELWEIIKAWMEYKDAKKPKASNRYVNQRSICTILGKFVNNSKKYSIDAVIQVTDDSIGEGYTGIVWDWLDKKKVKSGTNWEDMY